MLEGIQNLDGQTSPQRESARRLWLTWVFASAGVIWLGIMFALTMSDYATRGLSPFIFGR